MANPTTTLVDQSAPADSCELKRRELSLPPTLTKDEAARLGKRSVRSVERAIQDGKLPAFRSGGGSSRTLLLTTDVLRWLGIGAPAEEAGR